MAPQSEGIEGAAVMGNDKQVGLSIIGRDNYL